MASSELRVVKYRKSVLLEGGEVGTLDFYSLRTVFYDDEGQVMSWSSSPVSATGDSMEDLLTKMSTMLATATHDRDADHVLDLDAFAQDFEDAMRDSGLPPMNHLETFSVDENVAAWEAEKDHPHYPEDYRL